MYSEISDFNVNFPVHEYNSLNEVPVLEESGYDNFFNNFMLKNVPCVIKNVTCDWKSAKKWVCVNTINYDYLKGTYGPLEVTIYNCDERYFNSQKTYKSTLNSYLDYLKDPKKKPLQYLKDWHLQNLTNDDFYKVPLYFASDWLNEYFLEKHDDDYRFVYIGVKNTWTPFHADVFNSFSWSANICGQKRWLFFPPCEEEKLKDNLGNLPYDVTDNKDNGNCIELIQNEGDAVFVPSGWYHQVWNLKDTISINHNWVNGCNIEKMWISIENNLNLVKKEIEDCRDMDDFPGHCQVMLDASFGLDFYKFYDFLQHIAIKRINFLKNDDDLILYNGYKLGRNHAKFDLLAIKRVLKKFVENGDVQSLDYFKGENPVKLLNKIDDKLVVEMS